MPLVRDRHPLAKHWVIFQRITGDGPVDEGCVYVLDWAQNLHVPDCRNVREDGLCKEFLTRLHRSFSPIKPSDNLVVIKHRGKQRLVSEAEFGVVCQEP